MQSYGVYNENNSVLTDGKAKRPSKQISPSSTSNPERLNDLFRPFKIIMATLGLWHPSKFDTNHHLVERRWSKISRWLLILLSVSSMLYTFANFILFALLRPQKNGMDLIWDAHIVVLIWTAHAFLISLVHFVIFERGVVEDLWKNWTATAETYLRNEDWKWMFRVRNIYLIIAALATTLATMLVFAGMLHPNADDFLESLIASDNSTALSTLNAVFFYRQMAINITVLSLVTSGTAALTTAFFVMHCHLVTAELMSVFSEMQKYVENGSVWENIQEDTSTISVLEHFRRMRLWCRSVVEGMDGAFKKISFLNFFADVPLVVLIAYALLNQTVCNPLTTAIGIITMSASLIQIGAISMASAWVHKWAAKPRCLTYVLQTPRDHAISPADQASLFLLLNDLSSDPLGVTAWRLSVITKEFILTAAGIAVSYVIVLYELGHLSAVVRELRQLEQHSKQINEILFDTVFRANTTMATRTTPAKH